MAGSKAGAVFLTVLPLLRCAPAGRREIERLVQDKRARSRQSSSGARGPYQALSGMLTPAPKAAGREACCRARMQRLHPRAPVLICSFSSMLASHALESPLLGPGLAAAAAAAARQPSFLPPLHLQPPRLVARACVLPAGRHKLLNLKAREPNWTMWAVQRRKRSQLGQGEVHVSVS